MKSSQIIYSEHDNDECFAYLDSKNRVPDGIAVGYEIESNAETPILILFDDITYSEYDHQYWNNFDLENDSERLVIP